MRVNTVSMITGWFTATAAEENRTLQVGDHDLCVIGASEQIMCTRGESD